MKRLIIILLTLVDGILCANAQFSGKGYVTGSFDSNSIYYMDDEGVVRPDNRIGSNNYAKVNAVLGNFSAGVQWESYLPVLQGYPAGYDGAKLVAKYFSYAKDGLDVRVGDFYEQFGGGLLFRSWEDRDLGINTALEGFNVGYSFRDLFSVRAINGRPRIFMDHASSLFRGLDTRLSLTSLLGISFADIAAEWSYVDRYQMVEGSIYDPSEAIRPHVGGYSARLSADIDGFSLKGEYVDRAPDPMNSNMLSTNRGNALLVEAGYSGGALGVNAAFRQVNGMAIYNERESADGMYALMNYTPALTQQYTYTLASLNPYSAHAEQETGAQVDVFYNFARGSLIGGKRGLKAHLNVSAWFGPEFYTEGNTVLYYRDISFDIDKSISKDFKLKGLYTFQTYNPVLKGLYGQRLWKSHTVVADGLYKIDRSKSLRFELQHLLSTSDASQVVDTENCKYCTNWASALAELSIAPRWSFYAQDSWNYGGTGRHYYNGGVSLSSSGARVDLTFGRYMQGYLCSGGVCRMVPAYTGGALKFSLMF